MAMKSKIHQLNIYRFFSNQINQSNKNTNENINLQGILESFNAPIRFAMGYGSGVFPQDGYKATEQPLIDLVFGVTHPEHWHSLNIRQNRHHYSSLALLGSSSISKIQEQGAGIYYNTYVKINGMNLKYGVISMDRLLKDLNDWETLYVAGRMHKPINVLRNDVRVRLGLLNNRYHALRSAVLALPMEFTEQELFLKLAGLSYTGDFRMKFGENPLKISNIVKKQFGEFQEIYGPIIEDLPILSYKSKSSGIIIQDDNIKVRGSIIQQLPTNMQSRMARSHRWYLSRSDQLRGVNTEEPYFSQSIANSPELKTYVDNAIQDIVAWPAQSQTIKGLFSAGFAKSIYYVGDKLRKRFS